MNIWNFLGLPSKSDYDALIESMESLAVKNVQTAQDISLTLQSLMVQQQVLLQNAADLQQQLAQIKQGAKKQEDSARNEFAGMKAQQHNDFLSLVTKVESGNQSLEEHIQASQQEFTQRFRNAEASAARLSQQLEGTSASIQERLAADSDRYTQNVANAVISIADKNSSLMQEIQNNYASILKYIQVYGNKQSVSQSKEFNNMEAQLTQLFELMKCVWLSDLSDSLEAALREKRT